MIILPNHNTIDVDANKVSDGYHTFEELYEHRCTLFLALIACMPKISWASTQHSDGTMYEGWFVAGIDLPTGRITYHLPARMWNMLPNKDTGFTYCERAPEHDGHTSKDVVERLTKWIGTKERG